MASKYIQDTEVFSTTKNGLVPKPTPADVSAGKVLSANGQWILGGTSSYDYSTTEKIVGTWIDGKPVYEKTLNPTISVGDNTLNHDISNFKDCISITGSCKYNNLNEMLQLPYVSKNTSYVVSLGNVTATTYLIGVGTNFSSIQDCYITIRYTKTTD